MVLCIDGGKVAIMVDGKQLQEYGLEKKGNGDLKTHTCYIEATAGKEYSVVIKNFHIFRQGKVTSQLYIDGRYAGEFSKCAPHKYFACEKRAEHTFEGFQDIDEEGLDTIRAFTFARVKTYNTSNAAGAGMPMPKKMDEYGTIRVEITQKRRYDMKHHEEVASISRLDTPAVSAVPRGCPAAMQGYITKHGRGMPDKEEHTRVCRCIMKPNVQETKYVFIFKYMSGERLAALGIRVGEQEEDAHSDQQRDLAGAPLAHQIETAPMFGFTDWTGI